MQSTTLGQFIIYGVCSACLKKALKLPENRYKDPFNSLHHTKWLEGECDICHKITAVRPIKDEGIVFKAPK